MAKEARVMCGLQIRKGAVDYISRPTSFQADVAVASPPTPGRQRITTLGTDIDFSKLDNPGLCRIQNMDEDGGIVEYGIFDPQTSIFYPIHELLPGEAYPCRISRNLSSEYGTSPGTGTVGSDVNRFRMRALQHDLDVLVEAFER